MWRCELKAKDDPVAWQVLNYLSLKERRTEEEEIVFREVRKKFGYKVFEVCEICGSEYYLACQKCEIRFENKKLRSKL